MKQVLAILFFLVTISIYGQSQKTELQLTKDSDTTFWKGYRMKDIANFKLPNLNTESEFVFRRWNPGSLLEISKNQGSVKAKIIYFVYEVWENDYKADTFVKEYYLPDSTATELYKYVSKSGIQKIPSDKYIEEWKHGFDGITHIYELKENNLYSFKNFWTPKSQNGLKEAEFIIEFNKRIGEIGNLKQYGDDFSNSVPFITYTYSGVAYAITKPPTKKEWRKYKRERKKRMNKNKR